MKYITLLLKPASSKCQMRCRYCFYEDESSHREIPDYGVMSAETSEKLIDMVLGYFDEESEITWMFQGGEPTMASLKWFEDFTAMMDQKKLPYHTIHYGIQTNGLAINENWCTLWKRYDFLIGVSLDGFQINHDSLRPDAGGKGTYERIIRNISLLKEYGISFNILTVLTRQLAKSPEKFYSFIQKQDFHWLQLIPCLPAIDVKKDPYALDPASYESFFIPLFDLWLKELKKGTYRSVNTFDNIISILTGQPPLQCGTLGFCSQQYVIEANGNVYPCDFYCTDEWLLGNVNTSTFEELTKNRLRTVFMEEPHPQSKLCRSCRYFSICKGSCKRQSVCMFNDKQCGYQKLVAHIERQLPQVIRLLEQRQSRE